LLELGELENGVDGFLLRRPDERAGVHHDDPGVLRPLHQRVAAGSQGPEHHLGVHPVLRATQGGHVQRLVLVRAHRSPYSMRSKWSRSQAKRTVAPLESPTESSPSSSRYTERALPRAQLIAGQSRTRSPTRPFTQNTASLIS